MLSLHQTTEFTKKFLKWGGIFGVTVFLLFTLFRFGVAVKEHFFPSPPPPPTVSFGKLPAIPFPADFTNKDLTYTIDTLDGTLPIMPDRATVYTMVLPQPNLLDLPRAREKVAAAGIQNADYSPATERGITDILYQWEDNTDLHDVLQMNIITSNFSLTTAYQSLSDITSGQNLPTEDKAIQAAKSFLTSISSFPTDIDEDKTRTELLSIQNGILLPASSLSQAQIIRVNFYQKDYNKLPIFYPRPPQSTISVLVGGGGDNGQVVQADYFHQTVNENNSATYPIKTTEQAFEDLKNGKGFIASFSGDDRAVKIKNVELGYYLGTVMQQYLMPIIVFEGDNSFYAYVPAITSEWTEEQPTQ